ncbi:ABC-type cobalt transport system, permease component CbiQ [Xenococcus sp. PCC 7305]|uniref:energy-coupling factor transporter transmembrane component T family protein n=1 Tax=Xenococcus sp. PCC 7305 TaxID=102125 RepID=UPI0002ABF07F|nr:CbiQ family ECF transporter T component [Xenococcus sp. PCC 7305]ELS03227.1 ABC-type cobalt transport system, permease component CbiQ [Xenococcus sp. PCC 7305]
MDLLRSLPIGLYLEKPVTWLHKIDPRIKLVWLMTFLLAPLLANPFWRLGLSGLLIILTFSAAIPLRVWRQQMGLLLTISLFILVLTAFAPDGLAISHQPRLPADSFSFIEPPQDLFANRILNAVAQFFHKIIGAFQVDEYHYVLVDLGRFSVTRRSLDVAIRISTLIFTLIYSTNLYLLTTAPEEITAGLEDLMSPLRRLKIPVTEIALTLTLALRFIPLVLEEVQNLFRSVRTRAINWKKLGFRGSTQVWLIVVEKLLENLLMRAEQIAIAMDIRGFTSPNTHRVQWHQLRLRWRDWLALGCLIPFWIARIAIGGMF